MVVRGNYRLPHTFIWCLNCARVSAAAVQPGEAESLSIDAELILQAAQLLPARSAGDGSVERGGRVHVSGAALHDVCAHGDAQAEAEGQDCRAAVRSAIASQMVTHGFVRLRMPRSSTRLFTGDLFTHSRAFFDLPMSEKLEYSGYSDARTIDSAHHPCPLSLSHTYAMLVCCSRNFQPPPVPFAQRCQCVGYCARGAEREYIEVRRNLTSACMPVCDICVTLLCATMELVVWNLVVNQSPAGLPQTPGHHSINSSSELAGLLSTAADSAERFELIANATLQLLLDTLVGPMASAETAARLLSPLASQPTCISQSAAQPFPGKPACTSSAGGSTTSVLPPPPDHQSASLWRVHRYHPLLTACAKNAQRCVQLLCLTGVAIMHYHTLRCYSDKRHKLRIWIWGF